MGLFLCRNLISGLGFRGSRVVSDRKRLELPKETTSVSPRHRMPVHCSNPKTGFKV